jgi:hypothetical protein
MPGSHNIVITQIYMVPNTGWLDGCLAEKQERSITKDPDFHIREGRNLDNIEAKINFLLIRKLSQ